MVVPGGGNGRNDMRRATKDWDPWLVPCVPNDNSPYPRKCVFCGWSKVFVRKRAFSHFGYGGSATADRCQKIPRSAREKFRTCNGVVPKAMSFEELFETPFEGNEAIGAAESLIQEIEDGAMDGSPNPTGPTGPTNPTPDSVDSTPSTINRTGSRTVVSRQRSMDEALQIGLRQKLDGAWASFFYEANIAFNVTRHPAFINAVKETAAAGILYRPPAFNALRTKMIDKKKEVVAKMVNERTKNSIAQYGATICSDGWSDTNRRPLMNVMLVCPAGDVFLGSEDSTGAKKDIAYTTTIMTKYIEQAGPKNIVQLCTDNASVMVGTMSSLLLKYPHMYKQGCAAHILDLLLEDWGKSQMMKDLVSECRTMVKHIRKYHFTMALFRKHSPNKMLRLPALTRFATNFLMVDRLLDCKQALQTVVADDGYMAFEFGLQNRTNGGTLRRKAMDVRLNIHSERFWSRCKNFVFMVEPVLIALRHFDGKKPAMPKAWIIMNELKKHVYALRDPPFFLDPVVATRYEKKFEARWKIMRTDLHYAGALLNPFLAGVEEIQNDGTAKAALNRVIRKLAPSLGVSVAVAMQELVQFEEKTGPFDPREEVLEITETNLEPHQWWNHVGGDALPKIAKRILGLTCSASSCERNWSMYSFVHSKTRNRLSTQKAQDLVYIYANCHLERQKRGYNPAQFYERVLVDGDTEDEMDEPLPSEEEEEGFFDFFEDNLNRREEEELLRDNEWADMVPPPPSPPRYRYGNTFANGNDEDDVAHEEPFRSPERDPDHVWVGNWGTVLPQTVVRTPPGNNEHADNEIRTSDVQARSPVVTDIPSSVAMNIGNIAPINAGIGAEEEVDHIEEVVEERIPISIAVSSPTMQATEGDDYDSDAPLNTIVNRSRNVSSTRGGRTRQAQTTVRRSDTTPSIRGRTPRGRETSQARVTRSAPSSVPRAPLDGGPLSTINEEVPASAPQASQPTQVSERRQILLEEQLHNMNNRNKGKKRRIRRVDERAHRNPKRANQVVEACSLGAGCSTQAVQRSGQSITVQPGPASIVDGIIDATRPTKRLVQTAIPGGQDIVVRNLTSEVEREIRPEPIAREEDENASSSHNSGTDGGYASREDTDPNADEAENDSDFSL